MYMIDSLVLTTVLGFRFTDMVKDYAYFADDTNRFGNNLNTRTVRGGKAVLRRPWAYAGSTADNGFPRGRVPDVMRICNSYWETMRPMDPSTYNWCHLATGFCVPLDGLSDTLPRRI
jgi:hypothetical protein